MNKKILLCVGITLLFLGTCITPSVAIDNVKKPSIPISFGNTLYVGGTGEGNYTKIQDAIDDASNGDTVFVYNGTYYETVEVDKSINLIGEDRDITEIINEYEDYYAVGISADFVNISGFTIITYYVYERFSIGVISIDSCNNNLSDNIIIGEWGGGIFAGIELSGSSNNNTIIGNIILDNDLGIYISSSSNNIIKNNNFSGNWVSIDAYNSNNNIIMDNNFSKNQHDIILENNCINNTIISNTFSNIKCCVCINLYSSNKNIVMNNTIISVPGGNGILIQYSKENIIIGNTIKNLKWQSGIYLWSASDNIITYNNLICCNTGISSYKKDVEDCSIFNMDTRCKNNYLDKILNNHCGMKPIDSCNNNTIHHNNFFNNTQNAYDKCSNEWDNGYPSGGNFWDDYNGTDADGDGIGDIPYLIPGGDNEDRYPFMNPNGWTNSRPNIPIITGPTNGRKRVWYEYNFSISDPDGDSLWIHIDWEHGTPGKWDGPFPSGSIIKYNYSWRKKGAYTIRAQTMDGNGLLSTWGILEVTIPRNRATTYLWYQWFLERFPMLERLLTLLL